MHNNSSLADEDVFEALTVEQKAAIRRLFSKEIAQAESLNDAYMRGYRKGREDGNNEMLIEVKRCKPCKHNMCEVHGYYK